VHYISDIYAQGKAFFDSNPYTIEIKYDPKTRQYVHYLTSVRDVPNNIPVIAGEVLYNLRSALDHLAFQLVLANAGTPTDKTCFPIFDSAQKYKTLSPRKVKGMSHAAIKAIAGIKPYKGGNDTLWRLHKLNNIDKHRLLVTVGAQFTALDLSPIFQRNMQNLTRDDPQFSGLTLAPFWVRPSDRLFPLKVGAELFIGAPDSEVDKDLQFAFEIALSEPQIVEGEPIIETLEGMANLTENIVSDLSPLL
jgi:hypothetical protein